MSMSIDGILNRKTLSISVRDAVMITGRTNDRIHININIEVVALYLFVQNK